MTKLTMEAVKTTFGEPVTYTCKGLSTISITGVFDYESQTIDPNTGALIISNQPILTIKDDDLPQRANVGDTCSARDIDYRVIERIEDGQAGTRLRLHEL